MKKFGVAAKKSPQAVLSAYTKSLQFEWAFLQRIVDADNDKYLSLKNAISSYLTPAIFGCEVQDIEHEHFALPAKLGGLAIKNPMKMAERAMLTSKESIQIVSDAIKSGEELDIHLHVNHLNLCTKEETK